VLVEAKSRAFALNEIAPFAYNQGVEDAQKYFLKTTEDLPGTCFQEPLPTGRPEKERFGEFDYLPLNTWIGWGRG